MNALTYHLKLGGKAYVVKGMLDHYVEEMTVGRVELIMRHPRHTDSSYYPVYEERYMCAETGVNSGSVYTYFKNIFATRDDAEKYGVREHDAAAHKARIARDEYQRQQRERKEREDRARLADLKARYESAP